MDERSKSAYKWVLVFIGVMATIGLLNGGIKEIALGFLKIMFASDILISDYIEIAGIGPAFFNVAIVTLVTVAFMYYNDVPMNGNGFLTIGLMSGFSFFGKNFFNMWFIIGGTYIFCKVKKEKFSKYLIVSLISTALGPLISSTFFSNGITIKGILTSIVCGLTIGFVMPMLAAHTDKLLHGLSLYNGGFAVGLLALVVVPILKSYGFEFQPVDHWASGYNVQFSILLYGSSIIFIIVGYLKDKQNSLKNYRNILKRSGSPKEDFIELYGMPAVLINMGINCIIATSYIILIDGQLNGPTIGGIFTIVGFSAKGKHAKNIIPVMLGVAIGGFTKQWESAGHAAQLAALFSTTLAPIAGTYGIIAGIIAGFIHSSVTLHAGIGYSGVNLYNNGFAGGIVSIVMYSVLSSFLNPKKVTINDSNLNRCDTNNKKI